MEVKQDAVKLERKSKWIRFTLTLYHCGGEAVGTESAGRWVDQRAPNDVVWERRLLVGDRNRIPAVHQGSVFMPPQIPVLQR
jgi:hypothetical protein